jgi:hypothetical protein
VLRFSKVSALATLLLVACSEPEPADTSVSLVSEHGLVEADVRVAAPVERGKNQLFVELRPHLGSGEATLLGVRATMAAHGHQAEAASVERMGSGFLAEDLDLFMSGRWLLELELAIEDQQDSASLPVDVP